MAFDIIGRETADQSAYARSLTRVFVVRYEKARVESSCEKGRP